MDWVLDNMVWLAGVVLGVLAVAGLAYAVTKGIALYRLARATQGAMERHVAVLTAEAERAQVGLARVTEAQEALATHLEGLTTRIAVAKVLASHATAAIGVLRAPLKYLGR